MYFEVGVLATFFAAALAQMSIGCYPLGTGRASDCTRFINGFCNAVANDKVRAGDSSTHCYNANSLNRCDFMALNTGAADGPPSLADCQSVLKNATQCFFGGSGRFTPNGYTFIVDPNLAPCH